MQKTFPILTLETRRRPNVLASRIHALRHSPDCDEAPLKSDALLYLTQSLTSYS